MEVEPSPPTEVATEKLKTWLQTRVKDASDREIRLIDLFDILRGHRVELIKRFLRLDKSMMAQNQYDLNWMTDQFTTSENFTSDHEQKNLKILFSEINKLDDDETLNALRYKYINFDPKMFIPNYANYVGGRKLSRRRKSNPKSKSKLKRRRKSSHRRQSHRRQIH